VSLTVPRILGRHWLVVAMLGLMTFCVIPYAGADIFVYVDRHGVMHFTNTPTSSRYRVYMREMPKRPPPSQTRHAVSSYDDVISEAARRHGIAFSLLKALIHVESCFNPKAVSKKGALGLCQIMPQNLQPLNITDPFDPWENIMGGARYLQLMLNRFDGQLHLALAAYNAGPSMVEKYSNIPPFPETQEYVQKVLKYSQAYKPS
jgi:soluble lytic murein transglycosylase-like protein